jgi:hypothetical protein
MSTRAEEILLRSLDEAVRDPDAGQGVPMPKVPKRQPSGA